MKGKGAKRWKLTEIAAVLSAVLPFVLGILSLIVSLKAKNTASEAKVLVGQSCSHSNWDEDQKKWIPWEPYRWDISTSTVEPAHTHLIGLRKTITFANPFKRKPKITVGLKNNSYRSVESILKEIGTPLSPEDQAGGWFSTGRVYIDAEDPNIHEFSIIVTILVPTYAVEPFIKYIKNHPIDEQDMEGMVAQKFLRPLNPGEQYNDKEKWLINFYKVVGTVDLDWTAQVSDE